MSLSNRKLKFFCVLTSVILCSSIIFPQYFHRKLNEIPVIDGEGQLINIFSGGHNNIEHQFIDIDNDEDLDLFYLDSDKTFGWFKNTGNKFNPVLEYSLATLNGINFSDWFYLVDIDADNDYDFFTGNNDRISFYRNTGNPVTANFSLEEDTVLNNEGDPIYSEFGSNPVFADVDGDNDYDFITGNSQGTLTFYENTGTPQNFNLKFITNFWQDILIIGGALNDLRHGASAIDFVDIDDDNDLDLFWGDFFSNSIYYLENFGTSTVPDIQLVSDIYPMNADSVKTSGFNMPRFADIDADNDFDLFVSVLYDPTILQSLYYYRNDGTAQNANHLLENENFIKTLDVGNNSYPSFVDIDDDNDLDMFLGSFKNPLGTIHLLENTGTNINPVYSYLDSSYFNINNDLSVAPTFGDIDNDNDFDMIVGLFDGKLKYFENTGTPASAQFLQGDILLDNNNVVIDVGSSATPFLIDIDFDNDLDLVIGAFNGKIYLYRNTGNISGFVFTYDQQYFAGIDVGDNSSPFVFDFDSSGTMDFFTGNRNELFYYYKNIGTVSNPVWNEETNMFINGSFGGTISPYFIDINGDNKIDLLLGNVKGGLYLYTNSSVSDVNELVKTQPIEFITIKAYPNPFNPLTSLTINLTSGDYIKLEIFNILGEKVKQLYNGFLTEGEHTFNWDGTNDSKSTLPSGTYFALAYSQNLKNVVKLLLLK